MTTTTTNTNTVIIDSTSPAAVLRAWIGSADMGGWENDDEDAFRAAVRAAAARDFGIDEADVDAIDIEQV